MRVVFSGVVDTLIGPVVSGVALGDPFTVEVAYDPAAPPDAPSPFPGGVRSHIFIPPGAGSYAIDVGTWSIPEAVGGGGYFGIDLLDRELGPDQVEWALPVGTIDGLPLSFLSAGASVILSGPAGTLTSLALADVPLDVESWAEPRLSIGILLSIRPITETFVEGTITSIAVTAVPEPGTAGLVALGLLAVGAACRSRTAPQR